MTFKVTIDRDFEAFVGQLIESGRYASAGDVVNEALQVFEEREHAREAVLEALRADIQKGIDSGPATEIDPTTWIEEIKQSGRERLAAEKNGKKAS